MSNLCLAAIAIGSLPHTTPESATELIWKNFKKVPFWPQLAKVDAREDMIIQYTQNIPGMIVNNEEKTFYFDSETSDFFEQLESFYNDCTEIIECKKIDNIDKYGITEPYSSSFEHFLNKVKEEKPSFAKGQITGPFTWGTSITDSEKKCIFYDETYRDILVKALTVKALWQIKKIKAASPNTTPIIFLDEPTMSQFGTSAFMTVQKAEIQDAFKQIIEAINDHGGLVGIHCCGKSDWDVILECKPNIINFDAYAFSKSITAYSEKIDEHINNKGYIAWGIVPTLDSEALSKVSAEELLEKLETAIRLLEQKGLNKETIIQQSIITPSCGAGSLSQELAEKAMELTNEISNKLQIKYGVDG